MLVQTMPPWPAGAYAARLPPTWPRAADDAVAAIQAYHCCCCGLDTIPAEREHLPKNRGRKLCERCVRNCLLLSFQRCLSQDQRTVRASGARSNQSRRAKRKCTALLPAGSSMYSEGWASFRAGNRSECCGASIRLQARQNLPEGIHHPGFAAVGGKLYSVGGFTIARPPTGLPAWVPSKSVWIYHIGSASWSKGPDLPTARGALTATADGTTAAQAAGAGATAIVAGSAIFGTKDYAAAISAIRASAAAAVRS